MEPAFGPKDITYQLQQWNASLKAGPCSLKFAFLRF